MKLTGIRILSTRRMDEIERQRRIAEGLLAAQLADRLAADSSVSGVVFSFDRALQLDALLRSYKALVQSRAPLHVLYRASSERHERAYREVLERNRALCATILPETAFRSDTIALLERINSQRVFFLVDDILFVRPVDLALFGAIDTATTVASLRLGTHLSHCYTLGRTQAVPQTHPAGPSLVGWRWNDGECDWGYPLSLDGHLLSRAEVLVMVRELAFKAPNSLETALQRCRRYYAKRQGVCCQDAPAVNIPLNRVQSEYRNRSDEISPEWLLEQWETGKELDIDTYRGMPNRGAHEPSPVRLRERSSPPGGAHA